VHIHIYPIFTFGRLNWRHISFLRFLRHRIDAKDAPICVCAAVAHSYSVISSSIARSYTPASCIGGWLLSLCGSVLCFCIEHSCTPINPSLYCFRSARFVSTRIIFSWNVSFTPNSLQGSASFRDARSLGTERAQKEFSCRSYSDRVYWRVVGVGQSTKLTCATRFGPSMLIQQFLG